MLPRRSLLFLSRTLGSLYSVTGLALRYIEGGFLLSRVGLVAYLLFLPFLTIVINDRIFGKGVSRTIKIIAHVMVIFCSRAISYIFSKM